MCANYYLGRTSSEAASFVLFLNYFSHLGCNKNKIGKELQVLKEQFHAADYFLNSIRVK